MCGLANIPEWKNVPLARLIAAKLGGIPSCLDNDATCAAAAEFWVGAGRSGKGEKAGSPSASSRSLVVVTLGTGIGTGMVDNGKVIRGRGLAGELGHMIMDMSEDALQCGTCVWGWSVSRVGLLCCSSPGLISSSPPHPGCGQKGCLETVCSATGIARMYNTRADKLRCLSREDFDGGAAATAAAAAAAAAAASTSSSEPVSCAEVFSRLGAGETLATEVVDHCCEWLAVACLNISRAYDPDYIVFAGGVAQAGAALFERWVFAVKRGSAWCTVKYCTVLTGSPRQHRVRAAYARREGAVFRSLPGGSPAIVDAQAGEHCGILGAAYVVLEAMEAGTALV